MKTKEILFLFSTYFSFILYVFSKIFIQWFIGETVDHLVLTSEIQKNTACFHWKMRNFNDDQLWDHFEAVVNDCSPRKHLKLYRYENNDEFKYFRPPISTQNCTVVTLGVGKDVQAEKKLKIQHPKCSFVGADPVKFINELLYHEIGEFHQIAVGTENGTMNTLVYRGHKYTNESVPSVDLPYFLKSMVESTTIDLLLIDVEYGEYEMFDYFLDSDSSLEAQGIIVCQVNIEVHTPKEGKHKRKFGDFIRRLLADGRFHLIEASKFYGNKRLYFARLDHLDCV